MASRKGLKTWRKRLWDQDPHCRNCGVLTVLPDGIDHRDNTATIQHIYSKDDPRRKENNLEDITLFCSKCNKEDNQEVRKKRAQEIRADLKKHAIAFIKSIYGSTEDWNYLYDNWSR